MSRTHRLQQAAETILELIGPLRIRYCPLTPTPRQEAFLRLQAREGLYGGAAGGGKSVALAMSALQYCDVPGYHALILRPSLPEFDLPGGLIDLTHQWLARSNAQWSGDTRTWTFPGPGPAGTGGATLRFGYLDGIKDVHRYSGSSFAYVGFDELVRFLEPEYRRMFRVLRQPPADATLPAAPDGTTLTQVPIRARATSNPGGPGHGWVKAHFVDPATRPAGVIFLPSRLTDNPHLDHVDYIASLSLLPNAERQRLLHGDGEVPRRRALPPRLVRPHRTPPTPRQHSLRPLLGPAATEPSPANSDPDYTVGLRLDLHEKTGTYYVTDIVRVRKAPGTIEQLVTDTAAKDGRTVSIVIEEEPGAAGRALTNRYKQHILRGYTVTSIRPTGTKDVRARPVAAAAENGLLKIVRGRHTNDFLDELSAFPHGAHDDCVDALAGAHQHLIPRVQIPMRTYVARTRIPTQDDRFTPYWGNPLW